MRFRVIGPGRAGSSMADALVQRGWSDLGRLGRVDDHAGAGLDVDVVIVAVPDDAIAAVAAAVTPGSACLVHLSGAATLDRLAPHRRRASVHPLVSLPDPVVGARRLKAGATFAVAGDVAATDIVDALGGTAIEVPDERRAVYHAAAAVAANHLVALCAQVERLADAAGVPTSAYRELMARTLDNVAAGGAAAALTGPAARGDLTTVAAHLDAIDRAEHDLYLALADAAAALAGRPGLSSRLRAGEPD
ncbi:MAG: DUF2520 domain-containing protein [Actinomycetota bacterium]